MRKLIIGGALGLALLGLLAWWLARGTIIFDVIPSDASIRVGNHSLHSGEALKLSPGKHRASIQDTGFLPLNYTFTVAVGKKNTANVILDLDPSSSVGLQKLRALGEQYAYEGRKGQSIEAQGQKIVDSHPLIRKLPYVGSGFRVDYGASKRYPNDQNAVALYVSGNRQEALAWIRSQGYNSSDFEIIYQ